MRILVAASEAVPFAKAGGLADVAGALPRALAGLGHEVRLVLPLYGDMDYAGHGLEVHLESMGVPFASGTWWCRVHRKRLEDGLEAFFIEYNDYFARPGIYDYNHMEYRDNGERFAFFSMAALQLCRDTGWSPDCIHTHDWPTAMIGPLLKFHFGADPVLGYTGCVLTIHNIAYQGRYPSYVYGMCGLPYDRFTPDTFEDGGRLNMLKGGIVFSDMISTVSPTYAAEILTDVGGGGLHTYLERRRHDLHGILNGANYDEWNPEHDPLIPERFSVRDIRGKGACKAHLQRQMGLDEDWKSPLFGVVSRLVQQKGLDLLPPIVERLVGSGAQLAVLGSGDPGLEDYFRRIPAMFPCRTGSFVGYNNHLAHEIIAGADFFLMPSRFEPCGLTQMYSMRYGTLPVVRATGGLQDTVEAYDPATGEGTGFKFLDISPEALWGAVGQALDVWYNRRDHLDAMRRRAMERRFTWEESAKAYSTLYEWAKDKRAHWRFP